MAFNILFVDEQQDTRDNVVDSLSDASLNVVAIHPYASEEDMLNYIKNEPYDAIVFDYGLKTDDANIQYNGGDVINLINELREDFPTFILTQTIEQDDGVDEKVMPTKILMKGVLATNPEEIKRIIINTIKIYKRQNERISNEINDLIEKRKAQKGKLADIDIQKLSDLDEKMERRIHGGKKFPNIIKESESISRLNNILKEAEGFIEKNIKSKNA